MPFAFPGFLTELDPVTRKSLIDLSQVIAEWQSRQHKSDGSHSNVTADTLTITSDGWFIRLLSSALPGDPVQLLQVDQEVASGGTPDDGVRSVVFESLTAALTFKTTLGRIVVGESIGGLPAVAPTLNFIPHEDFSGFSTQWSIGVVSEGRFTSEGTLSFIDWFNGFQVLAIGRSHSLLPSADDYAIVPGDIAPDVYVGIRDETGSRFTEVAANMLYGHNGVEERSRTVPMGEWQSFTPTWTAATTAPALGNGLLFGRYTLVGKTCHFMITLVAGSTTTFGTGAWSFTIPQTAQAGSYVFDARLADVSAATSYRGVGYAASTTVLTLFDNANPSAPVAVANPFAWAVNDIVFINGTYEIA